MPLGAMEKVLIGGAAVYMYSKSKQPDEADKLDQKQAWDVPTESPKATTPQSQQQQKQPVPGLQAAIIPQNVGFYALNLKAPNVPLGHIVQPANSGTFIAGPSSQTSYTIHSLTELQNCAREIGLAIVAASGKVTVKVKDATTNAEVEKPLTPSDQVYAALNSISTGYYSEREHVAVINDLTKRLYDTGGWTTFQFIPKNGAPYLHGDNGYEVGSIDRTSLFSHLYRQHPWAFSFEIGRALACDALMRSAKGQADALGKVFQVVGKTVGGAVTGAVAGGVPGAIVGAVAGAIESVSGLITAQLEQHPKELEIYRAVELGSLRVIERLNEPLKGYAKCLPVYSFNNHQFSVSMGKGWGYDKGTEEGNLGIWGNSSPHMGNILQGFYTGPGLYGYNIVLPLMLTLDRGDQVCVTDWPGQYKGDRII